MGSVTPVSNYIKEDMLIRCSSTYYDCSEAQGSRGYHPSYLRPLAHAGERSSLSNLLESTSKASNYLPGWRFVTKDEKVPGDSARPDPNHPDFTHLRDIYFKVDPEYKGRFTVPTLYDVKQGKIVSNESSEIIRMFYTEFDDLLPEKFKKVDLLPKDLRQTIDEANEWTYNDINNGVYKSGFAT